ncbi:MAG: ferredoxin [Candidatus Woesearchaeota archaeon]
MVKVIINEDDCVGCGACVSVCPDNWELKDNGKASPKKTEVDEVGCNSDAADMCPTNAIVIKE